MSSFHTKILTILFTFSLIPTLSVAAINFNNGEFRSSFDYSTYSPNPEGFGYNNQTSVAGACNQTSTMSSSNNNPLGSGNALQVAVADGTNTYSGTYTVDFGSELKEFWFRWYIKYEKGFSWSSLGYDKLLYLYPDAYSNMNGGIALIFGDGYNNTRLAQMPTQSDGTGSLQAAPYGWEDIMGGTSSDGNWHSMEVHFKSDTNGKDGIWEMWVDGNLVWKRTDVNYNQKGISWLIWYSNQSSPSNNGCAYVWLDDLAVSTNGYIGPIDGDLVVENPTPIPTTPQEEPVLTEGMLFKEDFEDTSFAARGWYDNTSPILTSYESAADSSKSVEFKFPQGETKPISGGSMRKKFTESDSVYVSYDVKYSSNWQGSNKSYHPHEFYLLTNKSSDWSNLSFTPLTAYIEQNESIPLIGIQDGSNIDQTRIGQDLTDITEDRSVAGCNGDSDGYGLGSCYQSGTTYVNGKQWKSSSLTISTGNWHKVEAFLKLNSIVNGIGVPDGTVQYWLDGQLLIDYKNVTFRTGKNPDMKFNQFVIAPWIGDGSPIEQTFWVDNLTVATNPLDMSPALLPASGLRSLN